MHGFEPATPMFVTRQIGRSGTATEVSASVSTEGENNYGGDRPRSPSLQHSHNTQRQESETERGPQPALMVELMYLVFTRMPGESYRRRLGSLLLDLCYVFRALINSLVLTLAKDRLRLKVLSAANGHLM